MIRVVITKDEQDRITDLKVKGHACSNECGKDLVCAAVSAILVGGANALSNKDNFSILLKSGDAEIKKINKCSKDDDIVMNTIAIQLLTIEESYSEFIKVQIDKD